MILLCVCVCRSVGVSVCVSVGLSVCRSFVGVPACVRVCVSVCVLLCCCAAVLLCCCAAVLLCCCAAVLPCCRAAVQCDRPPCGNVTNVIRPPPCGVCRCHDLPTSHRNMDFNRMVLLVIPGPRAPKSWDAYLKRTLEKVAEMQTDEGAFTWTESVRRRGDDGSTHNDVIHHKHKVFLGAFFADLPGRGKAMCRGCTAAWIPCSWCLLQVRLDHIISQCLIAQSCSV